MSKEKELEKSKYKGKTKNNFYGFSIDSIRIRETKKQKSTSVVVYR